MPFAVLPFSCLSSVSGGGWVFGVPMVMAVCLPVVNFIFPASELPVTAAPLAKAQPRLSEFN